MDEFDLIAKYFRPLATSRGAAALKDDVAELESPPGRRVVVTTDAIVEDVHFLAADPLDTVAKKLVRANVSDCIAKGATPFAASLALFWPSGRAGGELEAFAQGLGEDLTHWSIALLGGDTVATPGPFACALSLHGACGSQGPVRRAGAQPGQSLWTTGTIGDGFLGLAAAKGELAALPEDVCAQLATRYRQPEPPRAAFADIVAAHASASIDISDGLIADAQHLAEASDIGVEIDLHKIPISTEAAAWLAVTAETSGRLALAAGGDDYQTLFCAPPSADDAIAAAAKACGVRLTCIGRTYAGDGVRLVGVDGEALRAPKSGWRHFSDAS